MNEINVTKFTEKNNFLDYLIKQQGGEYVDEQSYIAIPLETIIELEQNHYIDFKKDNR